MEAESPGNQFTIVISVLIGISELYLQLPVGTGLIFQSYQLKIRTIFLYPYFFLANFQIHQKLTTIDLFDQGYVKCPSQMSRCKYISFGPHRIMRPL